MVLLVCLLRWLVLVVASLASVGFWFSSVGAWFSSLLGGVSFSGFLFSALSLRHPLQNFLHKDQVFVRKLVGLLLLLPCLVASSAGWLCGWLLLLAAARFPWVFVCLVALLTFTYYKWLVLALLSCFDLLQLTCCCSMDVEVFLHLTAVFSLVRGQNLSFPKISIQPPCLEE